VPRPSETVPAAGDPCSQPISAGNSACSEVPLGVTPAPLPFTRVSLTRATDWLPRPDHLAESWYALREWAGRLVHALEG